MVKSVLKMMEQLKELLEHEKAGPGCTPEWLQNTYSPIKHYVRCELELSRSGGSEGERATRGKEVRCWECRSCNGNEGCPSKSGKWYSDTYMVVGPSCNAAVAKYDTASRRLCDEFAAVMSIAPKSRFVLA
jgi:hypothetical protein